MPIRDIISPADQSQTLVNSPKFALETYCSVLPLPLPSLQPFVSPIEELFNPHPRGGRLDHFFVQLSMLLSGGREGGFFIWNNLYSDTLTERPSPVYIVRAIRKVYNLFFRPTPDWQVEGGRLSFTDHYCDSSTKEALRYVSHCQPSFLPQIRQIVERLLAKGIKPVLITLPGLFSVERQPSEQALRIGHLPANTQNAYVLAMMTHKYNEATKKLSQKKGIPLIDLEAWENRVLLPPEQGKV